MRHLQTTKLFEKDLKRVKKRGKDLDKLWSVAERLLSFHPLAPKYRAHALSGEWASFMECHLEPDWLLIWKEDEERLVLARTGSHADMFG